MDKSSVWKITRLYTGVKVVGVLVAEPAEVPYFIRLEVHVFVCLIHVRDPQFYALPAQTRADNGRIRVMGFPPIGIMTLSAVLKRAGHKCVMFDQTNPETPNAVIIDEINKYQPDLVGLSFLSTLAIPTPRSWPGRSALPTTR